MKGPAALVGSLLLLSGCTTTEERPEMGATDVVQNTGELKLEPIQETEVPANRTLDAAPEWRMGEWWTYRLMDEFTGQTYEFKRIVTGREGDNYLVGMPADDFVNAIMVLHVPGFGEVKQSDLSFEVHDFRFEPLQFPLTAGKKWASKFEGPEIEVEVTSASGTTAEIAVTGAFVMSATYDAELGEISKLSIQGYGSYEITDHGVGYEGVVTVPHMHDISFLNFRLGALFGSDGTQLPGIPGVFQPPPLKPQPSDTVSVDSTYDRVSFAFIMGTVLPDAESPQGYYSLKGTAPDGTVFENTLMPTDAPGLRIWYYRQDKPGGDWTFDFVTAGPGIALAEGIAYHVYDVEMPAGRVLPSMGEHQHGG